jgi:uncharacterized protein YbjT (DUF2867 family)
VTVAKTAIIAGASGLVGGRCLARLLADPGYRRVVALVRRPLPFTDAKLEQQVTDFDRLGAAGEPFPGADDVYCCLGTTMKRAGSRDAFRRVDFTYVVGLAAQALQSGARQFLLVSALGANPRSAIFYNRVKGETETAVGRLPFEGRDIFRPSILAGARAERRPGERAGLAVMRAVSFALVGGLRKYRPIDADTVAAAMIAVAHRAPPGLNIYESDAISRLGHP